MIPEPLKAKLEFEAEKEHVSFAELIRGALEKYLLSKKGRATHDSFLSSQTCFNDQGPSDVSEKHDRYLLDKESH